MGSCPQEVARSLGVALHRAAVDAQGAGDTADGPAFGYEGLNGLLLGHFEDVGHAPRSKHTVSAVDGAVLHPKVVHFEALKVMIRWCTLSDRRQYT